jgi:TonB-linked SusC/RagA family outer membrane protein
MTKMRLLLREVLLCPLLLAMVFLSQAQSPTKTINGTIKDDQGLPIQGASVQVKGKKTGTLTDVQGHFTLPLGNSANSILVSHIGYESQEIFLGGKTIITASLSPSRNNLDEVVVVGYGTQKRRDLTGSVASVKGDAFKNQPVTNVTEALQGRAAGVEVIKNSGAPDATPTIIIRGVSSLHQPAPLYIVDGVRVPGDNINIQDIASVEILKDASSAAIYGSAAAGGVILITTKKGGGGKPTVDFNMRYGVSKPKLVHLLDKNGYIKLENLINPEYFKGAAQLDTLANTDWSSLLFRNGTEQNYNLSVNGSTPAVDYLFSGFYNRQKGVYLNNYSNIGGARVNTDYKLGKYIKIGEQLAVSTRRTGPDVPNRTDLSLHNAPFRSLPIIPLFNEDGNYGSVPTGYPGLTFGGPNPVGAIESASVQNNKNNLQSNVYAEVRLPLHLTFRTNFGYNYYLETQDYFQNAYAFGQAVLPNNSLNKYYIESTQTLDNFLLTYNQSFGEHNINAVIGYEQIANSYNTTVSNMTNVGIPGYSFVQTSTSQSSVSGFKDPNGLIKSEFGRLNYNYGNKYYVSGSIRQDANYTVFGPDKQKGTFEAASVGWTLSEEKFMKAVPAINLLKLRASYGTLGNSAVNAYTYAGLYTPFGATGGYSTTGQNFAPGAPYLITNSINGLPNANLHWETVTETNLGLDGEALKGRLYFTVEWYNKTTNDMLYALNLPQSAGIVNPYFVNIGSVSGKGVDLQLGYRDRAGAFGYDVSATLGFNRNKVTNLDGINNDAIYDGLDYINLTNNTYGINLNPITITRAGLPFGSFYGYKATGIFKTDAEAAASAQPNAKAGDLIFAHDAKNGSTVSSADYQVIGNPNPKLVYGINVRLDYKGFDVAMLFNGVAGVQLYNGVKAYEEFPFSDGNTTSKVFGASFLGGNGLTGQPEIGSASAGGTFAPETNGNYSTTNSYFVENGSYIKLKNLQIGYTFSNTLFSKLGIRGARLFVMANNLFTITKYSGLDPEVGSAYSGASTMGTVGTAVGVTTRGIDLVPQYPQTRIYTAGLDVNF